ncbi:MAG: prepilin peptidase [Patescibacteria group bacterium]
MKILILTTLFFLGACIGSFLNVVIYRLPRRKSFLKIKDRSYCPRCRRGLEWYDLIPVVSYLVLRGKCRKCGKKISPQYILVELSMAILVPLLWWMHGTSVYALIGVVGAVGLLIIAWIDGQRKVVPDAVSLPTLGALVILQVVYAFVGTDAPWQHLWHIALASVLGGGWFAAQWFLSKGRWVGSGDIRIGAILGAYLGLSLGGLALFGSYIFGSIWAAVLLSRGKAKFGTQLPFGVFLGLAGILTFLFGHVVVEWYQELIGF